MTGSPLANASTMTIPNGSYSVGRTKRSAAA